MIVGGVPAQVIRPRFNEKIIDRLLQSKWWEYNPQIFQLCDYKNPEKFLDEFEELKHKKAATLYSPEKTTYRHILNNIMDKL